MITTPEALEALIKRAQETNAVALDTEFVWEKTYYPKLGLIQLALSNEECFLIDPCALDDLSPLGELLADRSVVKIFHDAPQDLTILRTATGKDPKNIFDTRLAAGFAGFTSTLSLGALIELLLDIKLEKTETRTNWLKRPLNSKQTLYAMDDVRYLRAVRVLLLARVLPETLPWLEEELQRLDNPASYLGVTDEERYTKIKGAGGLEAQSLAILQELAAWREAEARHRNRPRGHIIKDTVLLSIARERLTSPDTLEQCEGISVKSVKTYGDTLIQLVNKGLQRPTEECPPLLSVPKLSTKEKKALTGLQDYITLKSDVSGIDPALLGNKSELLQCIRHSSTSTSRQKIGWRRRFLAEMESE
ncbi:ribonuclease D [Desulfocapsa sulfexigens DSM 10523]|uniref:Ribonuclease D n=1 Tax=Desulfocapsa sulfexigens (strain DSM 10523 / SB164P1) TaxID=1167006 RepID=M1NHL2_DESSD|nr:ribonuclease D [Desulfocapsa sulfexigens]AGF79089.1 ribonuclease D [Desulfocapsa sulfexigens DSM 10523]